MASSPRQHTTATLSCDSTSATYSYRTFVMGSIFYGTTDSETATSASSYQWSRAAVEADAVRATMPTPPISGGAAADLIADALGTPNPTAYGERANVTAFVVRQFVDRGLLAGLSATPDGTLHHPDQVAQVCRRDDLADLVAADTPLGPEQVATRLQVRRADFDHMVWLGWVRSSQSVEVRFGTSRAGAVDVALYTTASVDAVIPAHPEVDWEQLRAVEKGRRSPLAPEPPRSRRLDSGASRRWPWRLP